MRIGHERCKDLVDYFLGDYARPASNATVLYDLAAIYNQSCLKASCDHNSAQLNKNPRIETTLRIKI